MKALVFKNINTFSLESDLDCTTLGTINSDLVSNYNFSFTKLAKISNYLNLNINVASISLDSLDLIANKTLKIQNFTVDNIELTFLKTLLEPKLSSSGSTDFFGYNAIFK